MNVSVRRRQSTKPYITSQPPSLLGCFFKAFEIIRISVQYPHEAYVQLSQKPERSNKIRRQINRINSVRAIRGHHPSRAHKCSQARQFFSIDLLSFIGSIIKNYLLPFLPPLPEPAQIVIVLQCYLSQRHVNRSPLENLQLHQRPGNDSC